MGFFDFVEDIVGTVVGVIPGASTLLTAVGLPPPPAPTFLKPLTTVLNPLTLIPDPISAAVGTYGVTSLASGLVPQRTTLKPSTATFLPQGGPTMANGFFSDIFGTLGDVFSPTDGFDVSWGDVLDVGTSLAVSAFAPQPTAFPVAQRMPLPPMVIPPRAVPRSPFGGGMGGMFRSFRDKFPNLANSLLVAKAAGHKLSRSKAWRLLRQWGPSVLLTLGFTAEAINELMMAGPGHRRMNAGNARALRRSLRRVEAFDRLACRTQLALSSTGRRGPARARRRRCVTCKQSPCRC